MSTTTEMTVRFHPAIGWGFVGCAVVIGVISIPLLGSEGIVGLLAPVLTLLVLGMRFLNQRCLAYDPATGAVTAGNGRRAAHTFRPGPGERLAVEEGRIVLVQADGSRRKVPATRTWADHAQWDRVVEALEARPA